MPRVAAAAVLLLLPVAMARAQPSDDGSGWAPVSDGPALGDPVPDPEPAVRTETAAPPDPRWIGGHRSVALAVGLGSPTGIAGVELADDPSRDLAIHLGAGLGGSGPQLAAGARYVAFRPRDGMAYLIGGGLSFGDAEERQGVAVGGDYVTRLDGALWLDVDNAFELRLAGGWFARAVVGFDVVLASRDCTYRREASSGLSTGNPASSAACTSDQERLVRPALTLLAGYGF
jgi:hypothetical protein